MSIDSKMVDASTISRIKENLDITDIVSDYVSLKRAGQNYHSLCPFHHEKTPSFTVNPKRQIFHCFGCGEGGDLFTFIMKIDGLSFGETLIKLAQRAGVTLSASKQNSRGKMVAYQLNQEVAGLYHNILLESRLGRNAFKYLENRGISSEIIKEFQIGYAPDAWQTLTDRLGKNSHALKQLEGIGLVVARDSGSGYYDRFRNRIIFPINDGQGRVIGFGGRVLDDSLPKYLNSPETILFDKSRTLYGFDKARKSKNRSMLLVEGYMDLIMAWQYGLNNVVASLGTASGINHFKQIKRIADDVVLLFDGDTAGRKAALKALQPSVAAGLSARIACLPDGEDPDSFLSKHGTEKFHALIESAPYLLDFIIEDQLAKIVTLPLSEKNNAVETLIQTVASNSTPLERHKYIKTISEQLNVAENILGHMLDRHVSGERRKSYRHKGAASRADIKVISVPNEEEILIHLLLHNLVTNKALYEMLSVDMFSVTAFQKVFELIKQTDKQQPGDNTYRFDTICRKLENQQESRSLVSRLIIKDPTYDDIDKSIVECIVFLQKRSKKEIERKLSQAEKQGDIQAVEQLSKELLESIMAGRKLSVSLDNS